MGKGQILDVTTTSLRDGMIETERWREGIDREQEERSDGAGREVVWDGCSRERDWGGRNETVREWRVELGKLKAVELEKGRMGDEQEWRWVGRE